MGGTLLLADRVLRVEYVGPRLFLRINGEAMARDFICDLDDNRITLPDRGTKYERATVLSAAINSLIRHFGLSDSDVILFRADPSASRRHPV